ncbi:ABC-type Fe3+ transport system [Cordyceps militaris CM01]|uniref:ABC-type Fe3+ transport system n=1 Tax=Cordyceps militaris (strain CM01) TaxID=983644 RepID=G3JFL5_CORMM|nr:ABC-type Fe3+ transport system [Cordyceps militaris CM01]EGX93589.1 ABC-type Fe3+ transport system [Cordyceps militaris CM01]
MLPLGVLVATLASVALGANNSCKAPPASGSSGPETRSLDDMHKALIEKKATTVTVWHGGDEKNQQDFLKTEFEKRFPGMTLNITVDLSKYHDVRLDEQLAAGPGGVFIDSIILQTLNDYPRWASEGALLKYAPAGFDQVETPFKAPDAAWYGVYIFFWSNGWNTEKLPGIAAPAEYTDWLRPEFKNKLVLTYPHDDDAVLFAFDLIMKQYGDSWLDDLLKQNPRWVRGTATPAILAAQADAKDAAAFFATGGGFGSAPPLNFSQPTEGQYVSWAQYAGILKDAPNVEGAKLLHNFILSPEYQKAMGTWSVRGDMPTPEGFPDIKKQNATDPTIFAKFMEDRDTIEKLKLKFQAAIGPVEGLNPIDDDVNLTS